LIRVDGEDWRPRALEERKAELATVLSGGQHGIDFSEHLDDDGELIFKHACGWGWRASCPSGAIFLISRDARRAGSR
jgi:ATP-dependent DNA ligase